MGVLNPLRRGNGGYFVVSNGRDGEAKELVIEMKRDGVFGFEEFH